MTKKTAIFRCDASVAIGGGHIMRCLTVAQELYRKGWRCIFSVETKTLEAMPLLMESGFEVVGPKGPFLDEKADIIVIDNYDLSKEDEIVYRAYANRIVVFDDLANRQHDCDILLDQTFDRKYGDYESLVSSESDILVGSQYALLRPQFFEHRHPSLLRRKKLSGQIERVLISFGMTDSHNVTACVLDGLFGLDITIDVIVGMSFPHIKQLTVQIDRLKAQGMRIQTHHNVSDMASLMSLADISIGAGGTTSWERCCLGLPTIMIELAKNQHEIANVLSQHGCSFNLGWYGDVTPSMINAIMVELKNDPARVTHMIERAMSICDGRGVDRIMPYFVEPIDEIRLILMAAEDARILYDWQSFPRTRKFSRNPDVPSWDDHLQWFMRSLNNPGCFLYKIVKNGVAAGMLRLDSRNEEVRSFEVSILVAPAFYGQGVATAALAFIRKLDPVATLMAEILVENKVSRLLFQKAGYTPISKTWFEHKGTV